MKALTILTLALSSFSTLLTGCQTPMETSAQWEYKTLRCQAYPGDIDTQVNQMAAQNWKVVTLSTSPNGENQVPTAFILFKRHKR